jgi:ABC-type amino acid transport substrate-binding protein
MCGLAVLGSVSFALAQQPPPVSGAPAPAPAGILDRIRESGRLRLGYRADARPFSFRDESGQPAGYSIALCQAVADALKGEPGLAAVAVEWVPVSFDDRMRRLQQGEIHVLCGADTVTLDRRREVAFSIPIFPGGTGALIRADAPARLREVLSGRGQVFRPTWRASAAQVLQARAFTAVASTTAETWLRERIKDLNVIAEVAPVDSYETGIRRVLDRGSDVLFGERAILLDAAQRHPSARDLAVVDRLFTYEPLALTFGRGDEDFRLLVDRALSRLYGSGQLGALYTKWFGEPDESAITFFRWNTLSN